MAGERARSALAGTRFADVRWVDVTGSTNDDALQLARDSAPEGIVLIADHQTAGRGRQGRSWVAPPGASLLMTVLLRPPARVADATTMAVSLAAAEAVDEVAGVQALLKWPNDLMIGDRKLAGILAEADWPATSPVYAGHRPPRADDPVVVVVGLGLNVAWPDELPEEIAATATALNHASSRDVDREDLLIAFLRCLDGRYATLLGDGGRELVTAAWRTRSASLGRRVRVDLGASDVTGTAVDVTGEGHLVVEDDAGIRHTFAVGDVVHLRAAD
jgi:BirA family biotin operon repressor/biotin-[acetyl-CoA-carboxylase] ligase